MFSHVGLSQTPSVKTFVDKNEILIGEQVKYKVTATFPAGAYKVSWFTAPDSMAHFEVVDKTKIDTASENNNTVLQQTITLTSFDSGMWHTPALIINFDPVKDDSTLHLLTDSVPVTVGYAPADTTNRLRDIKPIIDVTVKDYSWYYIAGAVVLLLIAAWLLWRYFKNRKKQIPPAFDSKISPYDEAMQQLEKLKQLNLQNPATLKQYHAGLSEIFKWYISRSKGVSIMNKTTGDVLVYIKDNQLPQQYITDTATALRCGDAVKFAKYMPGTSESEVCFTVIKSTINFMHTDKPINQLTN